MSKLSKMLLLLLLGALLIVPVAQAQEAGTNPDLSEEEVALLETAIAATTRDLTEFTTQYTRTLNEEQLQETGVKVGEDESNQRNATSMQTTINVILGDMPNILGTIVATVENFENGAGYRYVMEAEVRRVEDQLYVNAVYTEAEGDVPALPEGWTLVDDVANFPEFEVLELDRFYYEYLDIDDPDEASDAEFGDILRQYATSVQADTAEVNGETVDVVIASLGYDGVRAILLSGGSIKEDDPFLAILDSTLEGAEDLVSVSLGIDSEGRAVTGVNNLSLNLTDVDMAAMMPDQVPAGTLLSLSLAQFQEYTVQYDAAFDPVAAPELP